MADKDYLKICPVCGEVRNISLTPIRAWMENKPLYVFQDGEIILSPKEASEGNDFLRGVVIPNALKRIIEK